MKRSKRIALLALLLALTVILSVIPIRVSSATLALTLLPVFVLALTQDFLTGLLGGLVMGVTSLVMAFSVGAASPTAPIFQNPLVSVIPRLFVPAVAFAVMKGLSALATRIWRRKHPLAAASAEAESGNTRPEEEDAEDVPAESALYDGAKVADVCDSDTPDAEVSENGTQSIIAEDSCEAATESLGKSARKDDTLPKIAQAVIDGIACLAGVLTNTGLVLGMMWAIYGGKNVGDTLISPEFMTAMISVNFVIEVVLFPLVTPPVVFAVRRSARKQSA